jgi:hypothetical protein
MTDAQHFFTKAEPLIQDFVLRLIKQHGLTVQEAGESMLATAITLTVAASGPERAVLLLRGLADQAERGAYKPSDPEPGPSGPLN